MIVALLIQFLASGADVPPLLMFVSVMSMIKNTTQNFSCTNFPPTPAVEALGVVRQFCVIWCL